MSNQEILEKAISKAIEGGWKAEFKKIGRDNDGYMQFGLTFPNGGFKNWFEGSDSNHENIIFSHDFAKALWPDVLVLPDGEEIDISKLRPGEIIEYKGKNIPYRRKAWQYHLQQMVIAPDPIQYLGENI